MTKATVSKIFLNLTSLVFLSRSDKS